MKLLFGLLTAGLVCACGAEPVTGVETVAQAAETVNVDVPPEVNQYVLGVFNRAIDRATIYRLTTSQTYINGIWITVDITEMDPENDCTRTNGYTETIANIVASETPRAMGRQKANDIMNDMVYSPWTGALCPPEEE